MQYSGLVAIQLEPWFPFFLFRAYARTTIVYQVVKYILYHPSPLWCILGAVKSAAQTEPPRRVDVLAPDWVSYPSVMTAELAEAS